MIIALMTMIVIMLNHWWSFGALWLLQFGSEPVNEQRCRSTFAAIICNSTAIAIAIAIFTERCALWNKIGAVDGTRCRCMSSASQPCPPDTVLAASNARPLSQWVGGSLGRWNLKNSSWPSWQEGSFSFLFVSFLFVSFLLLNNLLLLLLLVFRFVSFHWISPELCNYGHSFMARIQELPAKQSLCFIIGEKKRKRKRKREGKKKKTNRAELFVWLPHQQIKFFDQLRF